MEIQKWEYKSYFDSWPHVEPLTFERALNSLGDEVWELVSVVLKGIEVGYFFKRPAQLPSDIVFTSDLKKTTEDNIPGGSA